MTNDEFEKNALAKMNSLISKINNDVSFPYVAKMATISAIIATAISSIETFKLTNKKL